MNHQDIIPIFASTGVVCLTFWIITIGKGIHLLHGELWLVSCGYLIE